MPTKEPVRHRNDRERARLEALVAELAAQGEALRARLEESRRVEAALRESEARLRGIVDNSADGIVLIDHDGTVIEWSPGQAKITGVAPEEALGRPLWDVQYDLAPPEIRTPALREQIRQITCDALRTGEAPSEWSQERALVRRDGSQCIIQSLVFPVQSECGAMLGAISRDVTEQHRAQEALRQSEDRFRNLVEATSDWVWEVDARGFYTYASPRVRDLLGYAPEELLGKSAFSLMPAGEAERLRSTYLQIAAERRPFWMLENVNLHRDGHEVVLETSGLPFFDETGALAGYRGVDRDITQRKRAEERLRFLDEAGKVLARGLGYSETLERVARLAVPSFADWAVVDVSEEGDLEGAAVAHADPQKEALARELQQRYPLSGALRTAFRGSLRGGRAMLVAEVTPEGLAAEAQDPEHLRLVRQLHPTSWMIVPLAARGRLLGVMTFARTEAGRRYGPEDLAVAEELGRRAAVAVDNARLYWEAATAQAEAERQAVELDAIITSIADGVIIYGPDGQVLRMNAAAERLLGLTPEDLAKPITARMAALQVETPEGRPLPREKAPVLRALRGETVESMITLSRPPEGGERWFATSAAPLCAADGRILGAVASVTDITHLHQLQEQLQDLLRAVSHDLRNPLTTVQGQAELLLRNLDRAGYTGREYRSGQAILTAAQRMNTMIQDLVDSARLESGQIRLSRQPVSLRFFILDLIERQSETLDVARVRVEGGEGLPPVSADPDRLERVLINLISNSLKYSPAGSEVTVSLYQQEGQVVTAVSDRGVGIGPEEQAHIFCRFYRAKAGRERAEGLGLGLYITRMLVEAHGGRIWVESRPGAGSTFFFSLPLA